MSADRPLPAEARFQKSRARAIFILLALFAAAASASAQQAVILVRHAEKADASEDAELSEAGRARARALAGLLAPMGVTAIYVSEFRRTRQTAEPTAAALNLPVQMFPASDPEGLAIRLRTRHAGDVVLVVGHSNTLPDLMRFLGHRAEAKIEDDDFGSVFVLVPRGGEPPAVVRLRY